MNTLLILVLWMLALAPFAMAYRLSNDTRNKACDAIVDDIDSGTPPGTIAIRTGAQPTNVGDADTGTLLGTLTFSNPAFGNAGAVTQGLATAASITSDTSADNSGTAGHFRIKDGSGSIHSDGTCGAGSGDLSFDNNVIVAGGIIAISSMTVSVAIS
jgi:hypothetical protein